MISEQGAVNLDILEETSTTSFILARQWLGCNGGTGRFWTAISALSVAIDMDEVTGCH